MAFDIHLMTHPGLEALLADEVTRLGLGPCAAHPGLVALTGDHRTVLRANLELRGAVSVLACIGAFRAMHLAQLDKRARRFDWAAALPAGAAIRLDVATRASKIYHAGAARQRIAGALEAAGHRLAAPETEGALVLKVRIEDDLVRFWLDTSGAPLHRRGHKQEINKAPLRETLAAMFLRAMGYDGTQAVVDPMCGSGTFVIEAAEIAASLAPGRDRAFAFETLPWFDPDLWQALRTVPAAAPLSAARFFGSDRDQGAIAMSARNAARAGVEGACRFTRAPISDLTPPEGVAPGLVMVNPPYGARLGERKLLFALYGAMGEVLRHRFRGWRLGLVTPDPGLAKATGLDLAPVLAPVGHGGMRIQLYQANLS
jgi:putative N6-adenine-specific DNA methylase